MSVPIAMWFKMNSRKASETKTKLMQPNQLQCSSNRDIIRDHKKLPLVDVPNTVVSAARHDPAGAIISCNLKMLTEKCNDEKLAIILLIVGTGLIA